jgi:hypothetical protein
MAAAEKLSLSAEYSAGAEEALLFVTSEVMPPLVFPN